MLTAAVPHENMSPPTPADEDGADCTIIPPEDCNGNGSRDLEACECDCDEGYKTDYKASCHHQAYPMANVQVMTCSIYGVFAQRASRSIVLKTVTLYACRICLTLTGASRTRAAETARRVAMAGTKT